MKMKIKLAFTICILSLFAAQSGLAQVPVFVPFMKPAPVELKVVQPKISHTFINQALFNEETEVAAKQMWVGSADLLFHIEARESLKTVRGSFFKLPKGFLEEMERIFYAVSLRVILQEETILPHQQNLEAVKTLNHSA